MLFENILAFLRQLHIEARIPKGIEVLSPYSNSETFGLCEKFYQKYYNDEQPRYLMLGINPGRFGSGTTGVSFTDPIKLEKYCNISNDLPKKPELSADFIYAMIEKFGGPASFYSKYFVSAVSPLGFTQKGKNINYYDVPQLEKAVTPFIVESIGRMMKMGMKRDRVYCIGEGSNLKALKKLNDTHKWFDEIVPLAHPRFIMQYRRKKVNDYIDSYLSLLK
jgi:Domain of unknown function (DUF4918)